MSSIFNRPKESGDWSPLLYCLRLVILWIRRDCIVYLKLLDGKGHTITLPLSPIGHGAPAGGGFFVAAFCQSHGRPSEQVSKR